MDIGKLVMFGAIGYGAYWLYEKYYGAPAASATVTPAAPASSLPTAVAVVPSAPVAVASGPSTMDALYAAIVAAAAGDANLANGMMTGDHWNYYAQSITGKSILAAYPSGTLTAAQYWAAAAPAIQSATGLAGLGLFGGLGQILAYQRGWN